MYDAQEFCLCCCRSDRTLDQARQAKLWTCCNALLRGLLCFVCRRDSAHERGRNCKCLLLRSFCWCLSLPRSIAAMMLVTASSCVMTRWCMCCGRLVVFISLPASQPCPTHLASDCHSGFLLHSTIVSCAMSAMNDNRRKPTSLPVRQPYTSHFLGRVTSLGIIMAKFCILQVCSCVCALEMHVNRCGTW